MEEKGKTEPKIIDFSTIYSEHLKGLSSAKTPDLEIHISNEILKVHKIILASGNDVFKAMLDSQMVESKNNLLEITDCDPAAFKVFLAHLYTSQLPSEDISLDLLIIAGKYLDLPLTNHCIKKLGSEISLDNLVETVQVATKFNFEELTTSCQKFVTKNYKQLMGTLQMEAILENKTFVAGILKEYQEQCDTETKKYNDLLSSKLTSHKFTLGGLNVLLRTCEVCEAYIEICECRMADRRNEICENPFVHWQRFFIGDVEWAIKVDMDYDEEKIGISLKTSGKVVRANVEMTVLSYNSKFRNITIKKKDQAFGEQFFKVMRFDKFDDDEAYVSKGKYFTVELSINILDGEHKNKNSNSDSSDSDDSNSDSDNSECYGSDSDDSNF